MRLFGEVALLVDGEIVPLRSAKELGLLALLAEAHPRPLTRRHALEVLWPDSDGDRGRRSLNQAVYAIRQIVGTGALRAHLDLISLDGSHWSCDAWDLDEAVAGAARDRAPLPRFAAGGRLPDTPGFREWVDRVRSRVEAHLVAAYCAELKKLMDRGRFEAAEPLARAALEIDPYAETALYHLAMAMASSGRITAGLGEIRSAREKFRAELGRPLPAAFGELEARLESTEAFEARRRPRPNPKTLVLPFVGREEEFSHLRAAWDGIAATGRRIVLVSGEPGIGKTRLVERLGRLASIEGGRVLHADCYAAHRRVPFAAISEALRGLRPEEVGRLDTIWRRVLFAALSLEAAGTDLEPPPRLDPEAEQLRLFESVVLAVQSASSERPVLVLVDDLQWLDQSSAAVLQHLIRRCEDEPVLFVFAARERELRVDDELREFVANNRGAHFSDIELLGLDSKASVELLTSLQQPSPSQDRRGGRDPSTFGGHPLLLIEAHRSGHRPDAAVGDRGDHTGLTTPTLHSFLDWRIRQASDEAREIAVVLSSWDAAACVTDLTAVTGGSEAETSLALAELEELGLVTIRRGRATFRHALFRDWMYGSEPTSIRARCHSRIARYLETLEEGHHSSSIAKHFLAAGENHKARRHAAKAAHWCVEQGAHHEAEFFLAMVRDLSPAASSATHATMALADHVYTHLSPGRALQIVQGLFHKPGPSVISNGNHLVWQIRKLEVDFRQRRGAAGDIARDSVDLLEKCVMLGLHGPTVCALVNAGRVLWYHWDDDLVERVIDHAYGVAARESIDKESRVRAIRVALSLRTQAGDTDRARPLLKRIRAADRIGIAPGLRAELSQAEGLFMWLIGDLQAAEIIWTEALAETRSWGAVTQLSSALVNLGVVLHYRDRCTEALTLLREASVHAHEHSLESERHTIDANIALVSYENGDLAMAEAILDGRDVDEISDPDLGSPVMLALKGLVAVRRGRMAEAHELKVAADGAAASDHDPSVRLALANCLARSPKDVCVALAAADAATHQRLPGRACLWKTEIERARLLARAGRQREAAEELSRVNREASTGGAARVARKATDELEKLLSSHQGHPRPTSSSPPSSRSMSA